MTRTLLSKSLIVAGIAGGVLALPIEVVRPSGGGPIVRLAEACGQATECLYTQKYICSTYNKDWDDYKCTKGCGAEE